MAHRVEDSSFVFPPYAVHPRLAYSGRPCATHDHVFLNSKTLLISIGRYLYKLDIEVASQRSTNPGEKSIVDELQFLNAVVEQDENNNDTSKNGPFQSSAVTNNAHCMQLLYVRQYNTPLQIVPASALV